MIFAVIIYFYLCTLKTLPRKAFRHQPMIENFPQSPHLIFWPWEPSPRILPFPHSAVFVDPHLGHGVELASIGRLTL